VETLKIENSNAVNTVLVRYQFSNHLGSSCLELDDNQDSPQIISYEEYHPYRTTSYQAMNNLVKAAAKRYRYTGLERDEETGFGYHSVRYYIPWLGRWASCDPKSLTDGTNVYAMTKSNPINHFDIAGTQAIPVSPLAKYYNDPSFNPSK
jgi:RHS repeat-associated protein